MYLIVYVYMCVCECAHVVIVCQEKGGVGGGVVVQSGAIRQQSSQQCSKDIATSTYLFYVEQVDKLKKSTHIYTLTHTHTRTSLPLKLLHLIPSLFILVPLFPLFLKQA